MAAAKEMAVKTLKKAELATEMRLLAVAAEESVESDVDEQRKNLLNLKEIIRSLAQSLAHMLKEWELADAKCGKLEEELKSVMHEKDLLKRCCEGEKHLAEKLLREMEVMKREKDADMDILKAENKANASKISALEEMCYFLKEIRSQLDNKLEELKEERLELVVNRCQLENRLEELEEKLGLELVANRCQLENKLEEVKEEKQESVASYSEIRKENENVERNLSEFGPSEKEQVEQEETFDLAEIVESYYKGDYKLFYKYIATAKEIPNSFKSCIANDL